MSDEITEAVHDIKFYLDRIEELEAALQRLSKLDEFLNGEPSCVEEVINYTQSIARAALAGEKKDED